MTQVVHSRAEFLAAREGLVGPVGLVATMGALHAGHLSLIQTSVRASASTVVTVFVNPMQFGPSEDLARYPRTLDADLATCTAAGADLVWAPTVQDVYPGGPAEVRVEPGRLGEDLEGATRPGHFAGVLTVVAKFFGLVRPAVGFFGEKDYQQLTVIRQMAADLDLFVGVAGVPTVREPDGLALSSRNVYLSAVDRQRAVALSRALFAGQDAARGGAAAVLGAAGRVLASTDGVALDYLELRGVDLGPAAESGPARLLVAARVGPTRLIDNVAVQL
ncbi:MAG: pantoate--beta-alanine ligase [Jatrophihabitantaceae bacterium]